MLAVNNEAHVALWHSEARQEVVLTCLTCKQGVLACKIDDGES